MLCELPHYQAQMNIFVSYVVDYNNPPHEHRPMVLSYISLIARNTQQYLLVLFFRTLIRDHATNVHVAGNFQKPISETKR